jgi:hypothetical protein
MTDERTIIVAADAGIAVKSMADVADAIGKSYGADGLLLTELDLSPEFFDLRTGVAGEFFQKATNYSLRVAIVMQNPEAYGDRFSELVYEHKTHSLIRFFDSASDATSWLSVPA